jgi:serine/threonine protein phosphatase PrpC
MNWQGTGLSNIGCVRKTNQDSFRVNNDLGLWIVADGMGSHQESAVASQLAVESIDQFLQDLVPSAANSLFPNWPSKLQKAIVHASSSILAKSQTQPSLEGIGTTVVLAYLPPSPSKDLHIAHAGDSRAYLLRDTSLTPLTRDHTLLEDHIQSGLLPPSTPSNHKFGHVLTKAVGIEATIDADCSRHILEDMDKILLCSDGLMKMLEDQTILDICLNSRTHTSQALCEALIDAALQHGGRDNVTVILIQRQ